MGRRHCSETTIISGFIDDTRLFDNQTAKSKEIKQIRSPRFGTQRSQVSLSSNLNLTVMLSLNPAFRTLSHILYL